MVNDLPHFPRHNCKPLILGHRGASAVAPENTLAAFARAMRDGADGIELDVRLTRDGVPVIIHDANLKRTAHMDSQVSDLTAEELRQVDVGRWFAERDASGPASFAGEKVPTLAQVFELFKTTSGVLYVELKCTPVEAAALAAEVVRVTRASGMTERVVVESFDLAAIAEIKRIDARLRTAALFEPRLSRPLSTVRRLKMLATALRIGADEIALHHSLAAPYVVEKARLAGLEVVVWTVDNPEWLKASALGIKALICNDPGAMVRHRDNL